MGKKVEPAVPEWAIAHAAWIRLEDQLNWYDRKSLVCQKLYKRIKLVQIACAVLIPLISHINDPSIANGVLQ